MLLKRTNEGFDTVLIVLFINLDKKYHNLFQDLLKRTKEISTNKALMHGTFKPLFKSKILTTEQKWPHVQPN